MSVNCRVRITQMWTFVDLVFRNPCPSSELKLPNSHTLIEVCLPTSRPPDSESSITHTYQLKLNFQPHTIRRWRNHFSCGHLFRYNPHIPKTFVALSVKTRVYILDLEFQKLRPFIKVKFLTHIIRSRRWNSPTRVHWYNCWWNSPFSHKYITVKIDRGGGWFDPPGAVVDPLWKSAKMKLGVGLGQFELNNSLTHSNFRYFTFSGKISKYDSLEKFDPSWKKVQFLPWPIY